MEPKAYDSRLGIRANNDLADMENLRLLKYVNSILKKWRPGGVEAHIDKIDSEYIYGWICSGNSIQNLHLSLFLDETPVAENFVTDIGRGDVDVTGDQNGKLEFRIYIKNLCFTSSFALFSLRAANNGNVVAWKFFDLATALPTQRAIKIAENFECNGNPDISLEMYEKLVQKTPEQAILWVKASTCARKLSLIEKADEYAHAAFEVDPNYGMQWALMPMKGKEGGNENALLTCLNRMIQYKIEPKTRKQFARIATILNELFNIRHDVNIKLIYKNFLRHYLTDTSYKKSESDFNFFKDKAAILLADRKFLPYITPILNSFPFKFFDIIFCRGNEPDLIKSLGKRINIPVKVGIDNILDYKAIICDMGIRYPYPQIKKLSKHAINIGFTHSICALFPPEVYENLMIFTSSSHLEPPFPAYMSQPVKKQQAKMEKYSKTITELTYSGPFHFGKWASASDDKKSLRRCAEEKLGRKIPDDKPLLVCYGGGLVSEKHIINCLNELTDCCTIIFKPYPWEKNTCRHLLHEDIIFYGDDNMADNWLRFSADYMMCEFCKSSFYSSIMLGQLVLPFFAKNNTGSLCKKPKALDDLKHYYEQTKFASYIAKEWKYFFDIEYPEKIRDAIIGYDYKKWFEKKIKILQRKAFGDYMIEGADKKTAALMIRYLCEGTVGADCNAVYCKEVS